LAELIWKLAFPKWEFDDASPRGGLGEAGTSGIVRAIANAVFAATGIDCGNTQATVSPDNLGQTRRNDMIRKAKAVWQGTGRDGNGQLSSDSGVLAETPYSFKTRFENEKGTNPEELIAAAHAGCFTMALAFGLQAAGFTPTELSTEAAVTLEPEGKGFRISKSALTLRGKVPNVDDAGFARIAGEAEKNCPVSKVLNATITLDAKLI
jgi:osmotically inducible protein OsmC